MHSYIRKKTKVESQKNNSRLVFLKIQSSEPKAFWKDVCWNRAWFELRVTTQYNYFMVLSKQACNFKITKHLLFDLDDTQSLIYAFL